MTEDSLRDSIRQLVVERDELNSRVRGGRGGGRVVAVGHFGSALLRDGRRSGRTVALVSGYEENEKFNQNAYQAGVGRNGRNPHLQTDRRNSAVGVKRRRADMNRIGGGLENSELDVEKRPKVVDDDRIAKRSRALFGNMLGHLKKAKATLEKEKDTKQAECQKAQQERVQHKLEEQQKLLEELRRKALEEKRRAEVQRYEDIEKELSVKEAELLRIHVEKHYQTMMNFIRTRVQPTIFWLPAVHNETTTRLQEETRAAIELKISSLKEHLSVPAATSASAAVMTNGGGGTDGVSAASVSSSSSVQNGSCCAAAIVDVGEAEEKT